MTTRRDVLKMGAAVSAGTILPLGRFSSAFAATATGIPQNPLALTMYMDALPIPAKIKPILKVKGKPDVYQVTMSEFTQQLHSQMAPTTLWGYNGTYPGGTIETKSGEPVVVQWINRLPTTHMFTVDHTLHGADATMPDVRNVVHLHGGHLPAASDGGPEDWFTPGNSMSAEYPSRQPAATLWYHDHAQGITRLNTYAGLTGFWLIKDSAEKALNLPDDRYDIPLLIQDRTFDTGGQLLYPSEGNAPEVHPHWVPEFFGDTALVNGKVWPYLEVEPRRYRFRLLNGSPARFYNLTLDNGNPDKPLAFIQIGSDGGLLAAPVTRSEILMAPAERFDVIIDFTGRDGEIVTLRNDAGAPYPMGEIGIDAPELAEIMQFRVSLRRSAKANRPVPATLVPVKRMKESKAVLTRDITLEERMTPADEPSAALINGMHYMEPATETPKLGTTEIWRFINLTGDTHPIHLHLVQFQVLDRQPFDVDHYLATQAMGMDGMGSGPTGELVFTGPAVPPDAGEMGWKDTVRAEPGYVTRIISKFEHYSGKFVYHCHILEHEDNDMMRPLLVVP